MKTFDPRTSLNKTQDSDVKYSGPTVAGVSSGTDLRTIISETLLPLVEQLDSVKTQLAAMQSHIEGFDANTIKANSDFYDLVNQSDAVSTSLQNKEVTVEIKNSSTNNRTDVFFDLTRSLDALDPKYVPVNIETSIRTYDSANKLLGSSSSRTGNLSVDRPTSPIIINSRINLRSPEGDLVLSRSFYVPSPEPAVMTGDLQVSGLSTVEAQGFTQKAYNEILASNISKLQKDIASLSRQLSTQG